MNLDMGGFAADDAAGLLGFNRCLRQPGGRSAGPEGGPWSTADQVRDERRARCHAASVKRAPVAAARRLRASNTASPAVLKMPNNMPPTTAPAAPAIGPSF